MNLGRQLALFAGVGCCATLAHVLVGWSLMELSLLAPYAANLTGACIAYGISFFGNACLTFGVRQRLPYYAARYLLVSVVSLILTTLELALVTRLGLGNGAYALIVLVTVPPTTFLFAKLWAFAGTPPGTGQRECDHRIGAIKQDPCL